MEYKKIISLCISVINHSGMPLLFRLADVNEDYSLAPFKIDRSLPVEECNIDTIFRPRHLIPAEGTLELIEWYAYFDEEREKWHQEADWHNTDSTWLEYIQLDSVGGNEQFKQTMISGIDVEFEDGHGYLIEMYKVGHDEYMCAYCDASHFQAKSDGRYALNDRVYELDTFAIKESEIADMQARFAVGLNRKYFLGLEMPPKTGTIIMRNPADMVKKAVLARIKRCTEGFSKDERNIIRRFLRDCDTSSILESLVAEYRWSEERAESFLNDFVAHCDQYIADEDFLQGVLIDFVGNDNGVSHKYKAELKEEFEREFDEKMQHSYAELKKLDKKQEDAVALLNNTLANKSRIESEIFSLENEVNTKQQLASEVDEQIRSKISAAKNNIADFLSEYAMFTPSINTQEPAVSVGRHSSSYLEGRTFSVDVEAISSDTVLEYLSDNLQEIGVSSDKASVLGAYLLAAHSMNVPLIIAGYGASALVDALSITLYNKTSDRIYIDGKMPPASTNNNNIVMVFDAFGCIDKVVEANKGKSIYFIAQTSEELAIEPRSIFNYALPVFLEYFITDDVEYDEILGCILEEELKFGGDLDGRTNKLLQAKYLPSLAYRRLEKILATAQKFYGGTFGTDDIFMLQVMPIMLSLSMKEQLIEMIHQKYESASDATIALGLIGESNEYNAD